MIVQAEILAIGDELCYGRVYDTNSFWLADQATRLGVIVRRITCVRDDIQEICKALKEMLIRNPRFIFITGGLGPTEDDRTLEALAKFTGRKVVIDQEILIAMATRRKIIPTQFKPHQIKMISTLQGAKCRPNPVGWAPLTMFTLGETMLIIMPGPPREVQSCFTTYLVKTIEEITHYHSLAKRILITMFESEAAPIISQIHKSLKNVYLKPLVGESIRGVGLPVEVIVFGNNKESCQSKYLETMKMLEEIVKLRGKEVREFENLP